MKIILFDDFARDTRAVYQDVLAFLGLPEDGRREFSKVNERRMPRSPEVQSVLASLMRLWIPLRTRLTLGRGFGLGSYLTKWNTAPSGKVSMPGVQKMLAEYYADEISLAQSLLGRDLSAWRQAGQ